MSILKLCLTGRRAQLALLVLLHPVNVFGQPNGLMCLPERLSVRLIVPFAPGGPTDLLARSMEHVIVENRFGASGMVGAEIVAKASPDGRTLLLGNVATNSINPSLFAKVPYDALRDFAPISLVALQTLAIAVHPSVPAKTVKELLELARRRPGELAFATAGTGSVSHLAGVLLATSAGVPITNVPYKGSGQAVIAAIGGETQLIIAPIRSVRPHIQAGKLRVLASTGQKRSPSIPDTPTVSEAGISGYDVTSWYGLFAPAATPGSLIGCFNKSTQQLVSKPDIRSRLMEQGLELAANSPDEFRKFVAAEVSKWSNVIKVAGIKPQ